MTTVLALPASLHRTLHEHLHPGDGLEAAAVLVCTRHEGRRRRLIARDIVLADHAECRRSAVEVRWPGHVLEAAIDLGESDGCSLIAIHAHPSGSWHFSEVDNQSDMDVVPALHAAIAAPHGSAIMLPNGAIHARVYEVGGTPSDIELVTVAGDDIHFWWSDLAGAAARPMAFTAGMTEELGRLSAFVVGASGTGSPTIEQIARLGFGTVGMADFDHVEPKNLNRILNTTARNAEERVPKVSVLAAAVKSHRPAANVVALERDIADREAVLAAADADVLFCCTDSHSSRSICDKIAAAFCLPMIDIGVTILTGSAGSEIADVVGRVDYVQPGGATLRDRGVYTPASLAAEDLARTDPEAHAAQVQEGYIKGRPEEAPAVISLNMRVAAAGVMEFIARAYPFRHEPNRRYARTFFSLAAMEEDHTSEDALPTTPNPLLARGSKEPLLNMPRMKRKVA